MIIVGDYSVQVTDIDPEFAEAWYNNWVALMNPGLAHIVWIQGTALLLCILKNSNSEL